MGGGGENRCAQVLRQGRACMFEKRQQVYVAGIWREGKEERKMRLEGKAGADSDYIVLW